jgi:hypothetical protein
MASRRGTAGRRTVGAASRRIALLGVFAILLQAVLFGWHHHADRFAVAGQSPVVSSAHSGAPLSPATAEDDCEICAALHYLTAAPAEFIVAALPPSTALPSAPPATARPALSLDLAFRARAPPLA